MSEPKKKDTGESGIRIFKVHLNSGAAFPIPFVFQNLIGGDYVYINPYNEICNLNVPETNICFIEYYDNRVFSDAFAARKFVGERILENPFTDAKTELEIAIMLQDTGHFKLSVKKLLLAENKFELNSLLEVLFHRRQTVLILCLLEVLGIVVPEIAWQTFTLIKPHFEKMGMSEDLMQVVLGESFVLYIPGKTIGDLNAQFDDARLAHKALLNTASRTAVDWSVVMKKNMEHAIATPHLLQELLLCMHKHFYQEYYGSEDERHLAHIFYRFTEALTHIHSIEFLDAFHAKLMLGKKERLASRVDTARIALRAKNDQPTVN